MSRSVRNAVLVIVALGVTALALSIVLFRQSDMLKLRREFDIHTTGELIRYAKFRLQGHDKLEAVLLGPLNVMQSRIERPVPSIPFPGLGKGQQNTALAPVRYESGGRPLDLASPLTEGPALAKPAQILATTSAEIVHAVNTSKAGQTIVIAPGRYRIVQRMDTGFAGSKDQPIIVRANRPGEVTIEVAGVVGINVSQPFWVFENLHIQGICKADRDCEHAFHIVGDGQNVVIRNNLLEDFNAHIKVNGLNGHWPDDGLVQHNTIRNTRRRNTDTPVTPLDLVGASNWKIVDNVISNFVKGDGDRVSYGMFMKGAGRGGRIERNLIICTSNDVSQPGVRVGLSLGGGTTGKQFCRDQRCDSEFTDGLVANNVVAHCNDFGIDINRAANNVIAHNTLINTAGIDVRGVPASATIYGNLLEGRIRQRDGGQARLEMNEVTPLDLVFADADELKLGWRKPPEKIPSLAIVPRDFCARARADGTVPGAIIDQTLCPAINREH